MGLETATFIDELDAANPVTATDAVTEGSNHLRLIKDVLQNSFPNIDAAVVRTSAQINDAAQRSAVQTIDGAWIFAAALTHEANSVFDNNVGIQGKEVGGSARELMRIDASDVLRIGSGFVSTRIDGELVIEQRIGGVSVAKFDTRANGSLLLADSGGAFSEALRIGSSQTILGTKTHAANLIIANDKKIQATEAGASLRTMLLMDTGDLFHIGDPNNDVRFNGNVEVDFRINNTEVAKLVDRASGSLLVRDIGGIEKKAGFRNPQRVIVSASESTDQDYEGRCLQAVTNTIVITLDTLETHTAFRWMNISSPSLTFKKGTVSNMRWLDGSGTLNAIGANGVLVAKGSVVDFWYESTGTMYLFGNGISEV